jgi:hypothetical protein
MAAKFVPNVQSVVSVATTGGLLTVASSTGMYPSQIGWLSNGTVSQKVKVLTVPDGTHVTAQKVIDAESVEANSAIGNVPSAGIGPKFMDNRLKPVTYAASDLSAFTGGTYTLYCDDQLIYATDLSQTF